MDVLVRMAVPWKFIKFEDTPVVANEEEIGGQVLSWEQTAIKKNLSTKQPTIVLN